MLYYQKPINDIFEEFSSSKEGLTEDAVCQNREKFGENKLTEKKKKSIARIFLEQFKDLLVIILIIASLLSLYTGSVESTVVIIAVLILNAVLGTIQYVKAEKSLDSLKSLSSPTAKVIRGGKSLEINASDVVCGDIIRLDAGDIVPADARLTSCFSLKVNESSLTGESEAVEKFVDIIEGDDIALGDRKNMIFSGSLVTYGRALAVVTGVGHDTELGKIASLMENTADRKTPLQVTMDNFSKKLSIVIMIICAIIFGLNVYRGMDMAESMMFAVALAVAAIPEALSSIITISLAIGTSKMADQNAIIKQLNAVEGLGCVSVICSDKTGTLTQNKMTVEEIHPEEGLEEEMLLASVLCNDTTIVEGETTGDPTETAFVTYYKLREKDYEKAISDYPRLSELPFDSDRKLMSTLHKIDGQYVMYTKGAPDVVIGRADLDKVNTDRVLKLNSDLSSQGLRVLAFAKKVIGSERELDFEDENGFELLGMIAETDPPREESAAAVKDCIKAGIKPVMITGDHKITASAIAKKLGILSDGDIAVTGTELDAMSEDELMEKLEHISVYARVSPENKIRIVNAWQNKGQIVAMTGDGVNDAPALKSADVGVAMGITGTAVAKDSASMILTDDNFATIIKSVLNGRNIYENIKNAIVFLLSGNTAAILAVIYTSLLALPRPFTAVQLLFINLITDSLPALAISMEPSNPELIREKPRARSESILTGKTLQQIGFQGVLIAVATLIAFYLGLPYGASTASAMAFATLCTARLWHGFTSRGKLSIFKLGFTTNIYTIGAFVIGVVLLLLILKLPFLAGAFNIAYISGAQLGYIGLLSIAPTVILQLMRVIREAKNK